MPTRPGCSTRFGCPQSDYLENPKWRPLDRRATLATSEGITGHTASEEQFIRTEIETAFHNHGVAPDSALKAVLIRDAIVETNGLRTAAVRVRDEHGRVLSLDDKLSEMKQEFMYKHHFPKGKPVVAASDLVATRDAFDEIRTGRVRVE